MRYLLIAVLSLYTLSAGAQIPLFPHQIKAGAEGTELVPDAVTGGMKHDRKRILPEGLAAYFEDDIVAFEGTLYKATKDTTAFAVGVTAWQDLATIKDTKGSIVLAGDSITEGNETDFPTKRNIGAFHFANAMLGNYFETVHYAAVGGNTAAQVAARYDADVATHKSEWIHIAVGANDVAGEAVSAASSLASINEMLTKAYNAGAKVLLANVYPSENYSTPSKVQLYTDLNTGIELLARRYPNVYLVDVASPYMDKTGTDPFPLTGSTRDGVHPNEQSALEAGKAMYRVLSTVISVTPKIKQFAGDPSLVNANKFLTGTAGTTSSGGIGTVPTGYTGSRGRFEATGDGVVISINEANSPQAALQYTATQTFTAGDQYVLRVMVTDIQGKFRRMQGTLDIGTDDVSIFESFPGTEEAATFKMEFDGIDMWMVTNPLTVSTTGSQVLLAYLQFYGTDFSEVTVTQMEIFKID